jgi:hypothetical protein
MNALLRIRVEAVRTRDSSTVAEPSRKKVSATLGSMSLPIARAAFLKHRSIGGRQRANSPIGQIVL